MGPRIQITMGKPPHASVTELERLDDAPGEANRRMRRQRQPQQRQVAMRIHLDVVGGQLSTLATPEMG